MICPRKTPFSQSHTSVALTDWLSSTIVGSAVSFAKSYSECLAAQRTGALEVADRCEFCITPIKNLLLLVVDSGRLSLGQRGEVHAVVRQNAVHAGRAPGRSDSLQRAQPVRAPPNYGYARVSHAEFPLSACMGITKSGGFPPHLESGQTDQRRGGAVRWVLKVRMFCVVRSSAELLVE